MSYELHGLEGQAFMGFNEEDCYLERVTVLTEEDAEAIFRRDIGSTEDLNIRPIFMRFVTGEEAKDGDYAWDVDPDNPEWWEECPEDHDQAVPFWKEGP